MQALQSRSINITRGNYARCVWIGGLWRGLVHIVVVARQVGCFLLGRCTPTRGVLFLSFQDQKNKEQRGAKVLVQHLLCTCTGHT